MVLLWRNTWKELHAPTIILIGQDWGGLLGVRMIEQRPDLFTAFVGTGQIVSMFGAQSVQYKSALTRATAAHDEKILEALRQVGPPPYRTLDSYSRFQDCCRNPYWPADDIAAINRMKGALMVSPICPISEIWMGSGVAVGEVELDTMVDDGEDLQERHTAFSVPIFFIQGENDNVTPTSLVADYSFSMMAAGI